MKSYDLIIIGAGAGGFAAAIKANEMEANTLLINKGLPIGGTCVNVGCVPSKTLLYAGELMHTAKKNGIPGIDLKLNNFDFNSVVKHELNLVQKMREEKYRNVLNSLKNVEYKKGKAEFISDKKVRVDEDEYIAEKFIIATGSTANVPPIKGINNVGFVTHIEALKFKKRPEELIIIGAGPLGLEFAQIFSRFGTEVTILDRNSSIFSTGDAELVTKLSDILKDEGITIHTKVQAIKTYKEKEKKVIEFEVGGEIKKVSGDEILLAAGKTPNTKKLNLKTVGVEVDKSRAVIVNENFKTSNENIFAVGDVNNAPLRLETTAGREGTLSAENALLGTKHSIDYSSVPYTIFTDPQLSGVGLTEKDQMNNMNTCYCRTVSFKNVPKAHITNRTEGLISMTAHPKTEVVQGIHILAPDSGDLIAQAMNIIKNKNTLKDIISSTPVFPTMSEAIKIAALSFKKDIDNLSCCI